MVLMVLQGAKVMLPERQMGNKPTLWHDCGFELLVWHRGANPCDYFEDGDITEQLSSDMNLEVD